MNNGLNANKLDQLDIDPEETKEWLEALSSIQEQDGNERVHFIIGQLVEMARQAGADIPFSATTAYINTIPVEQQPKYPGMTTIERKIRSYVRWNAMMMVLRANKKPM